MELLETSPISTEPARSVLNDSQLDASYRTLDRVLGTVQMADNKALIALTFQGAIIAGLALVALPLQASIHTRALSTWDILLGILLFGFFGCLALSTLKLFQTISPRIVHVKDTNHPSMLFYFGGIASMSIDEFADRLRDLGQEDIHTGIATITHVNSSIALKKFANLRVAFMGLGLQVLLYVVLVLVSLLR